MKHPDHSSPSENETIEATAAAWLAQRDDGLNGKQLAEFARWHEADPRHAAAIERLEETWVLLGQLRAYRPEARVHPDRDLLAKPRPALVLYRPAVAATGLLAAALVFAAVWLWVNPVAAPLAGPQQFATTADGYQRMTLADGSVIELNAESEVQVAYVPAQRRVRLVKGEAHFIVKKDPQRPFWVEAGTVTVRAVGTAFNVRLSASEIEVLVTEGKVEVDQGQAAAVPKKQLVAGEKLTFAQQNAVAVPVVEMIEPAVMRNVLSWQDTRLIFSETPLANVVEQFNQHNRVKMVLADPELATKPVDGSWRAGNTEGFVRMLSESGEIVVDRSADSDQIILRKAP